VRVELNEVSINGTLGPVVSSTVTTADGGFRLPMPPDAATSSGKWLVTARAGTTTLRAHVHNGSMRVDVGSEAWVRLAASALGRTVAFPGASAAALKSISRSVGLFADVRGAELAGLAPDGAAAKLTQLLRRDRAMAYVLSTLASTAALPAGGVSDVGNFFALHEAYTGEYTDGTGRRIIVTLRSNDGSSRAADGSWSFVQTHFAPSGNLLPVIPGEGGMYRATTDRLFGSFTALSEVEGLLSGAIGEFPLQSFPLRPGVRQLDARRIERSGLNFTGGEDDQPISFSSIERVEGVETLLTPTGPVRAVKWISELEIGMPSADGSVSRITARTTGWLVPGMGSVKELAESLQDGVASPVLPEDRRELQRAWSGGQVWPNAVTIDPSLGIARASSNTCAPVVFPERRRVVTRETGPSTGGVPTLALALWDMDSGMQIGPTRLFDGFRLHCPVAAGTSDGFLIIEPRLNQFTEPQTPTGAATAAASSDVVHWVSADDLRDLATYVMPPVADLQQPDRYWPAGVRSLHPAPDGTGRFLVAFSRWGYAQTETQPRFTQVLGPGGASPIAALGPLHVAAADWHTGRLFTRDLVSPFTLAEVRFAPQGVDPATSRTITTDFRDRTPWYVQGDLIVMHDGSSLRVSSGTGGPALGFNAANCGYGTGLLICLDWQNDQLIRFDPSSLTRLSAVPLASDLRQLARTAPDFRSTTTVPGWGIHVLDATSFVIDFWELNVGLW